MSTGFDKRESGSKASVDEPSAPVRSIPGWGDWYMASLEAGRLLDQAAEVVYFASELKQRLHQHQVHALGVEHSLLKGRHHLPCDLSFDYGGSGKRLVADQFVKSLLNWATLVLHATDPLMFMLRALRRALGRALVRGGRAS